MKIKLKIITMLAITIVVLMSFTSTINAIHYTGSDDEVVDIGYQYLWNKDVFCVQHGLDIKGSLATGGTPVKYQFGKEFKVEDQVLAYLICNSDKNVTYDQ